jgi:hypothetical protein
LETVRANLKTSTGVLSAVRIHMGGYRSCVKVREIDGSVRDRQVRC